MEVNKMNTQERNKLIKEFFDKRCMEILEQKGQASTGGTEDANRNFKECILKDGENTIADDIHAWWIYYIKHVVRLKEFIVNRQSRAEDIKETIADLVNYSLILYTILIEHGIIEINKEPNKELTLTFKVPLKDEDFINSIDQYLFEIINSTISYQDGKINLTNLISNINQRIEKLKEEIKNEE
jgi:hypothetical protein